MGPNPADMTAKERLNELGDLLGAGLIRMEAGKSSQLSASDRDCLVDFSPQKSGVVRRKPHNRVGG